MSSLKYMKEYYVKNKKIISEKNRKINSNLKLKAHKRFGNKCACPRCPETNYKFLSIDRIDPRIPDKDKRKFKGIDLCRHILLTETNLSNYQLLCWNCNCAKSNNLAFVCPHMEN